MSTICPTCHLEIPKQNLACPICTERNGNRALAQQQLQFLRKAAAGKVQLITRRAPGSPARHVQMFGYLLGFCGVLFTPQSKPNWIDYESDEMKKVCVHCSNEIERLMALARAAPREDAAC